MAKGAKLTIFCSARPHFHQFSVVRSLRCRISEANRSVFFAAQLTFRARDLDVTPLVFLAAGIGQLIQYSVESPTRCFEFWADLLLAGELALFGMTRTLCRLMLRI